MRAISTGGTVMWNVGIAMFSTTNRFLFRCLSMLPTAAGERASTATVPSDTRIGRLSINYRELLAVLLALHSFRPLLQSLRHEVQVMTENIATTASNIKTWVGQTRFETALVDLRPQSRYNPHSFASS